MVYNQFKGIVSTVNRTWLIITWRLVKDPIRLIRECRPDDYVVMGRALALLLATTL
jgi:hypothetical protein